MKYFILVLVILLNTACTSAGNSISRVTSLPAESTPASQSTVTATMAPTQVAASTLEASPSDAATATPLNVNLAAGNAMEIAAATDMALRPTPRNPMSFDVFPVPLLFDEFYDGYNLRTGLILSDKLLALDGQAVVMEGYMAPPLKPELDYFVLTRIRLAFCPFCTTAGDWPDDIALIYLPEQTTTATESPVRVTGRMEVGASVDHETGMVSLVRIYAERLELLN
jgi:hypothetical protein